MTIPGYHRAYTPSLFGLSQIAPKIYIDNKLRSKEVSNLIANAEKTVSQYFGEQHSFPRTIICTTQQCSEKFNIASDWLAGEAQGQKILFMYPNGIDQETATHELVHIVLGRKMDEFGMLIGAIPIWFNEGLATHLSRTDDRAALIPQHHIAWIKQIKTSKQWRQLISQKDPQLVYLTASAAVAQIENKIGRQGILRLIEDAASGETNFNESLESLD